MIVWKKATLFYFKCVDQRMDDRSLAAKAAEKAFRKKTEALRTLRPVQVSAVENALTKLWDEEKKEKHCPQDNNYDCKGNMIEHILKFLKKD